MSSILLLLSALLLSSLTVVRGGGSSFASLMAPPTSNSATINTPIIDTAGSFELVVGNNDDDSVDWILSSDCPVEASSCNSAPPRQDNWLYQSSPRLLPSPLSQTLQTVRVTLNFTLNSTVSTDNDAFGLFVLHSSVNSSSVVQNFSAYVPVAVPPTSGMEYTIPVTDNYFTIGIRDYGTCVIVHRLQVYYESCVVPFADGLVNTIALGNSDNVNCVSDTVTANPAATCSNDGVLSLPSPCMCLAGHSGEDGNNCTACSPGTYKALTGPSSCLPCPAFTTQASTAATVCTCNAGHVRADPANVTLGCNICEAGYYQDSQSGECQQCPPGSNSFQGTSPMCTCDLGLVTATESTTTTTESCDRCVTDYFRSAEGNCVACPTSSSAVFGSADSTSCMCNNGRATSTGGPTATTVEACDSCAQGFYSNGAECSRCPAQSTSTQALINSCVCNSGYARSSGNTMSVDEDCVVIIGFTVPNLTIAEGSSFRTLENVTLRSGDNIDISVNLNVDQNTPVISLTGDAVFTNNNQVEVPIDIVGNQDAFNSYSPYTITISERNTFVAGGEIRGQRVFESLVIMVTEDDAVNVGFSANTVQFNETEGRGAVTVQRVGNISMDLTLSVILNPQAPSPIRLVNSTVLFRANGPNTAQVSFFIINDNSGDGTIHYVVLQLGLMDPIQFRDHITLGGPGLHEMIRIGILSDEEPPTPSPLPLGTLIGICVGAAVAALLVFIIIILVLCICRLRSVNRQGFYTTHEDEAKEPPTMLRYSASLRSISSQTVMPVENAQSPSTKENEYYV